MKAHIVILLPLFLQFSYVLSQLRLERGFSSSDYQTPPTLRHIPIIRMENNNDGANYQYAYETGNKIIAQGEGDGSKARGAFSYTAPDGQQYSMSYTADETGFHPQAAHLPIPPPMPEAILKSVQENLAQEARGVVDDGQYREGKLIL